MVSASGQVSSRVHGSREGYVLELFARSQHQQPSDVRFMLARALVLAHLTVIAQPVAKVDALDHPRVPLVATQTGDGGKHVLDVAMSPVLALDLGDGCDVPGAKGLCCARQDHQRDDGDEQEVLCGDGHVGDSEGR